MKKQYIFRINIKQAESNAVCSKLKNLHPQLKEIWSALPRIGREAPHFLNAEKWQSHFSKQSLRPRGRKAGKQAKK